MNMPRDFNIESNSGSLSFCLFPNQFATCFVQMSKHLLRWPFKVFNGGASYEEADDYKTTHAGSGGW